MGSTVLINGDCHKQALRQYPNDPNQSWVIQKFGGTSVGKFSNNLVEEIVRSGQLRLTGTHTLQLTQIQSNSSQSSRGGRLLCTEQQYKGRGHNK